MYIPLIFQSLDTSSPLALSGLRRQRSQINRRAGTVIEGRLDKVWLWVILICQSDQALSCGIKLRPVQLLLQSLGGVLGKTRPRFLHQLGCFALVVAWRNSADVFGSPEDHLQVASMVGPGPQVEADIVPVAKIAVLPYWNVEQAPVVGLEGVGASEGLEEELVTLGFGDVDPVGEGWNHVIALFIVVIPQEVGLSSVRYQRYTASWKERKGGDGGCESAY